MEKKIKVNNKVKEYALVTITETAVKEWLVSEGFKVTKKNILRAVEIFKEFEEFADNEETAEESDNFGSWFIDYQGEIELEKENEDEDDQS